MKEIYLNWRVNKTGLERLCQTFVESFKTGVTLKNNCISLDNIFVKGRCETFFLTSKIILAKTELSIRKPILLNCLPLPTSEYFKCIFSLNESVDLHAFSEFKNEGIHRLGLPSLHAAYYCTSNVRSILKLHPCKNVRFISIAFAKDELNDLLLEDDGENAIDLFLEKFSKGYIGVNADMLVKLNALFDHNRLSDLQNIYYLGAVYELLAELMHQVNLNSEKTTKLSKIKETSVMIQIRNTIVSDFSKDCPHLDEMARKANMSISKFKILFKRLFKLPYFQYYQHHRLLEARQSLVKGKSVAETAYEFGFSNPGHFCTAFKKKFKIPPSTILRNREAV